MPSEKKKNTETTSEEEKKKKSRPETSPDKAPKTVADDDDDCYAQERGLLTLRRQRIRKDEVDEQYNIKARRQKKEWLRPYWLGVGLFLVLFAFWLLDSLKDPIFGILTGGSLDEHQPPAKLFSVCATLFIVCFLEYIANERQKQRQRKQQQQKERSEEDVLDGGGNWSRMTYSSRSSFGGEWVEDPQEEEEDGAGVPSSIFASIGIPYSIFFGLMAYLLQFNPSVALTTKKSALGVVVVEPSTTSSFTYWHALGYFLYAAIESFGSIAVATFWSFTNSTLSLDEAERYYGLIIAIAQLGAIAGSTMVTTHVWSNITLMILSCLIILLHVIVMMTYSRRFQPTSVVAEEEAAAESSSASSNNKGDGDEPTFWSGVHLILKYNYVLLILGASCLYEVSLTCLNYQMTLLGWKRFEETEHEGMSFTQFMGHYGQMVNASSLILSSIFFPWLIRRFGLRLTLRLFPTLLLLANVVAFGAIPGNLAVLFLSMSTLKAMTYSIHDPSKEILYLPTSNAIKFKSKFWIDVVGARIAKAIGSSINRYAGSVDRSIRVASAPSLLTAAGLWLVCYRVGKQFDQLVATDTIVGLDNSGGGGPPSSGDYSKLGHDDEEGLAAADDDPVPQEPTSASVELSSL